MNAVSKIKGLFSTGRGYPSLNQAIESGAGRQARSLLKHLDECGINCWSDITRGRLYELRDHLERTVAPSSAKTYLAALRAVLNRWAEDVPMKCGNFGDAMRTRGDRPVRVYLTPEELARLESVETRTQGERLSQLLFLMISLSLKGIHMPKTSPRLSRLYWLAILCLPTGSLLIYLLVISDYYNPAGSGIFLPVSSILLLLNLLTFYVLDRLEEYSSAYYERELLEQQNRAYRAQFDLMQQSEHQVRALRHDMKNHLTMLQAFAARGETDTLTQYLSTCSEQLVQPGYVHTGNPEIDGILNYKLEHAHQLGAKLELDISLPERLTASPFDLNVILGNLLDNAVEGLARSGEKRLSLSLRFDRGMLFLRLTNTYDGVALKTGELEGGVYRSRKDESGHGLGLSIVRRTVEKYHGQLRLEDTGTLFTAEAVLYLDS